MSVRIGIIDAKLGNITSVANALGRLGYESDRLTSAEHLDSASALILPGVGAFPVAMERLHANGFAHAIRSAAERGVPILGICLGMQLLADSGEEHRPTQGLGIIGGAVTRLSPSGDQRVPHVGWNPITPNHACPLLGDDRCETYYFVHSFAFRTTKPAHTVAHTEHGGPVPAVVQHENVFGVQFHPEKSQHDGLALLDRFAKLAA